MEKHDINTYINKEEIKIKQLLKTYYKIEKLKRNKKTQELEKLYTQLANLFVHCYTLCYDKYKRFWEWNTIDRIWEQKEGIEIENEYTDYLQVLFNKFYPFKINYLHSTHKNLIDLTIKREAYRRKFEELSSNVIFFKNKGINIETNEIVEADPKYFITNKINWELDDSESTPTIDKIFTEWVGKDKYMQLEEVCAYCLLRNYPLQRFFTFLGKGANGKSSFEGFLGKLIGKNNIISTDLIQLTTNRFEVSRLENKLVAYISETAKIQIKDTSILKSLTGNDEIRSEEKFKSTHDFVNFAKIIISTNQLPKFEDDSDGFFRRLIIIPFSNQFTEQKDILNEIPEVEYSRFCRKCITLSKKLITERKFTGELSIKEKRQQYLQLFYSNLTSSIGRNYNYDQNNHVDFRSIYDRYQEYCESTGIIPEKDVTIGRQLNILGYKKSNYPYISDYKGETSKLVIWGLKEKDADWE